MRQILLLLVLLSTTAIAADPAVVSITGTEWPPYVSEQLYGNGVAIVAAEAALQRAGYATSNQLDSWPAALDKTKAGDYDVIAGIWRTAERERGLVFSEPVLTNYIVFVKRDDSEITFNVRADLNGLRIGVVSDYAYSEEPYDTTGLDISERGSARQNIERLRAGELDLVLADSRVASYEINQLVAAKELTVIRKPLLTRQLRIAVSKKNPNHAQIINAFNDSLESMRADGSYNELLATFRVSQ